MSTFIRPFPTGAYLIMFILNLNTHSLLQVTSFLGCVIKAFITCGSPEDSVDSLLMMACSIVIISKALLLYMHRDKLASVVYLAMEDWKIIENEEYRKMMLKRSNFCNTATKFFYSMGMFVLVVYTVKVMFLDGNHVTNEDLVNGTYMELERRYILPYGCIFDGYGNALYYCVLVNQWIQMIVMCVVNMSGDAFYIAITLHLCEQCQIMKLALEKFGDNKIMEKNHQYLKVLIARHQDLMIRAEKMEDIYNDIIFAQMFYTILSTSFAGIS